MKIKKLQIYSYGQIDNEEFDFNDGFQEISLKAVSEKDTIKQAIVDILFGFPKNNPNLNSSEKTGGKILVESDESIFVIERTYAVGLKIFNENNQELSNPQVTLIQITEPINQKIFEEFFLFTADQIKASEFLDGKKLTEQINLLADGETSELLEFANQLEDTAKKILNSGDGQGEVNKLLEQVQDLKKQIENLNEDLDSDSLVVQLSKIDAELTDLENKSENGGQTAEELKNLKELYPDFIILNELENDDSAPVQVEKFDIDKINELQEEIKKSPEKDFEGPDLNSIKDAYFSEDKSLVKFDKSIPELEKRVDLQRDLHNELVSVANDAQNNKLQKKYSRIRFVKGLLEVLIFLGIIGVVISAFFYNFVDQIWAGIIISVLIVWLIVLLLIKTRANEKPQKIENKIGKEIEKNQNKIDELLKPLDKISGFIPNINNLEVGTKVSEVKNIFSQINGETTSNSNTERDRVQDLINQQKSLMLKYGYSDFNDFDSFNSHNQLLKNRESELDRVSNLIDEETKNQLSVYNNEDEIQEAIDNIDLGDVDSKIDNLKVVKGNLQSKLDAIESGQSVFVLKQKLESLKAEIIEKLKLFYSYNFASVWIEQTTKDSNDDTLEIIQAETSVMMNKLSKGKFMNVDLSDSKITLINENSEKVSVNELKAENKVQLYVAIRFALAENIASINDLPLIIESGFVDFQIENKTTILEFINTFATEYQIIYLVNKTTPIN